MRKQDFTRVEDRNFISGAGRYTDDIVLPDMLHAAFARSPYPHARLTGIDTTAAATSDSVLAVLTLADYIADGCQPLPYLVPHPRNNDGIGAFIPDRWPLANDRLRHVGDPFAVVIAETIEAALEAVEAVEAKANLLAPAMDMASALQSTDPLWEGSPENICFIHDAGDAGAADAAFEKAAHIVSNTFTIPRVSPTPLEPRGCVAAYDAKNHSLTVFAGIQDVFSGKSVLAKTLGMEPEKIDVVSPHVGGSFGLKYMDPETVVASWAAHKLKRPVKWISTRSEAFVSDNHSRDNVTTGELALSDDGEFLALRVRTDANVGAYAAAHASASPINNLGSLAGVYRTPAIHVRVTGVFTNTNPTGPYRGAGRPEASYVIERLVDMAAEATGLDRTAIRRRNMIAPDEMPFTTGLGVTYDVGEFETVMDKALSAGDWHGFDLRKRQSAAAGKLRGIGIATVIERATLSNTFENVRICATPEGGIRIAAGSTDQGQGHLTMYTQLASDLLGLAPDNIEVVEADTRLLDAGGMTGSSRVSAMGSAALIGSVDDFLIKAKQLAANELEADRRDIEFAGGRFTISGTDRGIGLDELIRLPAGQGGASKSIELEGFGSHTAQAENFPNGCHMCEVEIDRDTGKLTLCSYLVVDDVGNIINETLVKGQLHGGIAQGIGETLMEAVTYDEDGQLLSGSFMDYAMPRAADLCSFDTFSHGVPTTTNPLGVKGAGEAGLVGALPALTGAVLDALRDFGIRHIDMPLTSARIWQAINNREN